MCLAGKAHHKGGPEVFRFECDVIMSSASFVWKEWVQDQPKLVCRCMYIRHQGTGITLIGYGSFFNKRGLGWGDSFSRSSSQSRRLQLDEGTVAEAGRGRTFTALNVLRPQHRRLPARDSGLRAGVG